MGATNRNGGDETRTDQIFDGGNKGGTPVDADRKVMLRSVALLEGHHVTDKEVSEDRPREAVAAHGRGKRKRLDIARRYGDSTIKQHELFTSQI